MFLLAVVLPDESNTFLFSVNLSLVKFVLAEFDLFWFFLVDNFHWRLKSDGQFIYVLIEPLPKVSIVLELLKEVWVISVIILNILKHSNRDVDMSFNELWVNFFIFFLILVIFLLELISVLCLCCFSLVVGNKFIVDVLQLFECFDGVKFIITLGLPGVGKFVLRHFKYLKFVFKFSQIANATIIIIVFHDAILSKGQYVQIS